LTEIWISEVFVPVAVDTLIVPSLSDWIRELVMETPDAPKRASSTHPRSLRGRENAGIDGRPLVQRSDSRCFDSSRFSRAFVDAGLHPRMRTTSGSGVTRTEMTFVKFRGTDDYP
jgi:hypothetical protein